ncbi:MAG: rhodanese-like domain-containing protein [Defluviitaleaceae bacterium]|nr:rhodanese-like domain-containing protein [Defluviitaleaceae bacterium]
MKILVIGDIDTAPSADHLRFNVEGADVVLVDNSREVLRSVDTNVATLEEISTGRVYQQEFDILVHRRPATTDPNGHGDVLHLQEGGCPNYQWRQIEGFLKGKGYTTANVVGDCVSAAQAAVNLYAYGIMPTVVTTTDRFPRDFDRDVAAFLRKQLTKWDIVIMQTTHPYLPYEEGRATLFFGDQQGQTVQDNQQILAPNLAEKFGEERAAAVLAVVRSSLVPPRNEGALVVSTRYFQAGLTGASEERLIKSAVSYIYSVLALHGGFIKLVYGAGGKIYGFSAVGAGSDGFVDIVTTLITCGGSVGTLANLDFISPYKALVQLGKTALDVINSQIHMAYPDEIDYANPDITTLLDVRNYSDFAMFNIPNSVNIPLSDLKFGIGTLSQNKDIIVISNGGNSATAAVKILYEKGYKARVLTGGLKYYKMRLNSHEA